MPKRKLPPPAENLWRYVAGNGFLVASPYYPLGGSPVSESGRKIIPGRTAVGHYTLDLRTDTFNFQAVAAEGSKPFISLTILCASSWSRRAIMKNL